MEQQMIFEKFYGGRDQRIVNPRYRHGPADSLMQLLNYMEAKSELLANSAEDQYSISLCLQPSLQFDRDTTRDTGVKR